MCIELPRVARALVIGAAALAPLGALAHGPAQANRAGAPPMIETDFGRTGDARKASRTVRIGMADTMRFTPAEIEVKRGEAIRFVVTNAGKVMHEMVLGTLQDLRAHAEMMKKHPGMQHDEPYMVRVPPGKAAEIVWQFTKAGEFHHGCLIPGHFEAGMVGRITVR
jgi:uncharacterized cupredoxin-like copper-binding protein